MKGVWGAYWKLDVEALAKKICDHSSTPGSRCSECREPEIALEKLISAAQAIEVDEILEKCQNWVWDFDELPPSIRENECYKTGTAVWSKHGWFPDPIWPGHAAIKVEVCDGTVFYLDSGFWGGADNVFAPPEIGGPMGNVKWPEEPEVPPIIVW